MWVDGRINMAKLIGAFRDGVSTLTNKCGGLTACRKNVLLFKQSQCLEGKIIRSSNVLIFVNVC